VNSPPVSTAIYDPTFTAYDNGLLPPITTYNQSAIWGSASYPDVNPVSAMQLTVQLSADANCLAPSNADPAYQPAQCSRLIAPAEFQIGLRAPDGTYYPLLDRESSVAAQAQAASLCMNFYHNQMPTYCGAPATPLTFGQSMPAVVGKMLTGNWRIVVTRTGSIITENPIGTLHGQGGANVTGFTLTATTDAPCGVDLKMLNLGLSGDDCETGGTGDRNTFFEPGETANLRPQIFNNGAATATGVVVGLSSTSSALAFTSNNQPVANLAPGATAAPGAAIVVRSSDSACNALPVQASLTAAGYSGAASATLQQGQLVKNYASLATALADLSASNTPGNGPWLVSNTTGATYDSTLSRFDYRNRCGVDANTWPYWTGTGPPVSPKPFGSEPYLLGPLFTNRSCTTRVNPGAGLPDPVCFYTANPNINSLLGNGVNYIHLDTSNMTWGIPYNAACTDLGGNSPPAGMDARLTSNPVSAVGYSTVRLIFPDAFWTRWDVGFAPETPKRDNIATVEVASSITDAGTACPLETGTCPLGSLTCRRWCEVFRLQNYSTPYLLDAIEDISPYAAGATNVQVRFRFKDDGWLRSSSGDLWWALRDIRLQGLASQTINTCVICPPCQSPLFAGLASAADADTCAKTGVNLSFNDPNGNANWGDGGKNSVNRVFQIFRSDNPATPLTTMAWTGAPSYAYNDGTGLANTLYNYWVVARNGCGRLSNTASVTRSAMDAVGVAPSGFANNSAVDASLCLLSGITVGWSAPSGWGDVSGTRTYAVLRNGASVVSGPCSGALPEATLNCTDTTAAPGVSYTYTVRATNGCGLATTTTPGATATDLASSIPTGFTGISGAADLDVCVKSGVRLTWSNAGITWNDNGSGARQFLILRDGVQIATALPTDASYVDTTGAANVAYLYQIVAHNGCGNSTPSTGGLTATDAEKNNPPNIVTGLIAAKGGANLNLNWNPAQDVIANYRVYADASPGPLTTLLVVTVNPNATDTLASANRFFQVTAVDNCGRESGR
jgi:hypothetical protein